MDWRGRAGPGRVDGSGWRGRNLPAVVASWPNLRPCVIWDRCWLTTDWATIASFATALGTLVLAVATFAAIRSSNRSARIAEASFEVNLRPVLVTSRLEDPVQKIRWVDNHWAQLPGSQGTVEWVDESIYLTISLRNVGPGLAVLYGWSVRTELVTECARSATRMPRTSACRLVISTSPPVMWVSGRRQSASPATRTTRA